MEKDFDAWNALKKRIDARQNFPFAKPPEVWWCAFGLNVGIEMNGKHDDFERPVIIVRAFNAEMLRVVPLTTRNKASPFYLPLKEPFQSSRAVVSQARIISARRLLRLIGKIDEGDLREVRARMRELGC